RSSQSLGCACPLQSITLASTMPAARATPAITKGFGPPLRRFFALGRDFGRDALACDALAWGALAWGAVAGGGPGACGSRAGAGTGVEAGPQQLSQHVCLLASPSRDRNLNSYSRRMQQVRQVPKPDRQRLIASVVGRRRVGSQHELQDALRSAGCEVTQATISRDIRELGLEKSRDVLGRPRYVLPERGSRSDPHKLLEAVLAQFGLRAMQAQNIVG